MQTELTRIQNRISRWFSIYFPEYKDVDGKPDAKSGMMVLKVVAPLPEDIVTPGVDGVNRIWREAKSLRLSDLRERRMLCQRQNTASEARKERQLQGRRSGC